MASPRRRSAPQIVVKPRPRFAASSTEDSGRHFHDQSGTSWRPRRHDGARLDTKLALALSGWRLAHGEMPSVRFFSHPVPARIDLDGAGLLIRWEGAMPRIEIASGPAVWIVGQVDAVALVSISGDEGALRQLGIYIAEAIVVDGPSLRGPRLP
jgi:hypothetical protein